MSQFYKVLKADPLGEPYTPSFEGAKATQTYWCQLEGVDKDVSIGKQVPNTLTPGEQIYGDLMYAKSQKGTEYGKFKSAKVPEGVTRPASSPAQAQAQQATGQQPVNMSAQMPDWFQPWANILTDLHKWTKKMDGEDITEPEPAKPAEPTTPEPATPVDEDTMAVINEIFPEKPTEPETPEGV